MTFLPPRADPYPPHEADEAPPSEPEEPRRPVAWWPLWAPFLALVVAVLVAGAVSVLLIVAVEAFGIAEVEAGEDPPPGVTLGGTFVQDIMFAVAVVGLAWFTGARRPRPADFGLRATRFWRALGWLVAIWVGFIAFSAVYASIFDIPETDDLPRDLGADESTLAMLATALLVCVMAPIAEELLFRGFLFGALRERMHVVLAIVVSGVVFALVHVAGSPVEFLPALAALGAGLAWLYHQTGSLYPCIALHAINNSIALGASLDWDWQVPVTMVCSGLLIGGLLLGAGRLGRERHASG